MPGSALLTDIRLQLLHHRWRAVYASASAGRDFALVEGRENLGQAVALRLLTPRGELAALGHPEYGSRLHELIGQPNSATRRNLAKLYVLDALRGEARIAAIAGVDVAAIAGRPDCMDVTVRAVPVGAAADEVTIGPFRLELRMSLRRRTFPEVLDNVLTALMGGVAAEAHPFPPAAGGERLPPLAPAAAGRRGRVDLRQPQRRAAPVPPGRRLRAAARRHDDRVAQRRPARIRARSSTSTTPRAARRRRSTTSTPAASRARSPRRRRWRSRASMRSSRRSTTPRSSTRRPAARSTRSSRCSASSGSRAGRAAGEPPVRPRRRRCGARSRSSPGRACSPPTAASSTRRRRP